MNAISEPSKMFRADLAALHARYLDLIIDLVALYFDVDRKTLLARRGPQRIVEIRFALFFLIRQFTTISVREIACFFGRSHSIFWLLQRCDDLIQTDPFFRARLADLSEQIATALLVSRSRNPVATFNLQRSRLNIRLHDRPSRSSRASVDAASASAK